MKKTYRIKIKIKKCDIIFKEELGPGIVAQQDYIYEIDDKAELWLAMSLDDYGRILMDDVVETIVEEVIP